MTAQTALDPGTRIRHLAVVLLRPVALDPAGKGFLETTTLGDEVKIHAHFARDPRTKALKPTDFTVELPGDERVSCGSSAFAAAALATGYLAGIAA